MFTYILCHCKHTVLQGTWWMQHSGTRGKMFSTQPFTRCGLLYCSMAGEEFILQRLHKYWMWPLHGCLPLTACLIASLHANRAECWLSGLSAPCYVMPGLIHCSKARVGIPSCTWKWAVGRRMEREAERRWRGRTPCSTKRRNGGLFMRTHWLERSASALWMWQLRVVTLWFLFIIRAPTVENRNGYFKLVEMSETSCKPTLQAEIRILKHIQFITHHAGCLDVSWMNLISNSFGFMSLAFIHTAAAVLDAAEGRLYKHGEKLGSEDNLK